MINTKIYLVMKVLYDDVRVRDRVRDLLLTYMYTLNFLNNYFIAI
jgi:hypothetical protein